MMTLEQGAVAFFNDVPAITTQCQSRIYGIRRPQGVRPLPELLISRVQTERQQKFCGQDLLVKATLQIDCYGINADQATSLAKSVRLALRNFSGQFGDVPVGPVYLENEYSGNDVEPGTIRTILNFGVWYQED